MSQGKTTQNTYTCTLTPHTHRHIHTHTHTHTQHTTHPHTHHTHIHPHTPPTQVDENWRVKVADFGLSQIRSCDESGELNDGPVCVYACVRVRACVLCVYLRACMYVCVCARVVPGACVRVCMHGVVQEHTQTRSGNQKVAGSKSE